MYLPGYIITDHRLENREQLLATFFSFGVHLLLYGLVILPIPLFKHRAEDLFEKAIIVSLQTVRHQVAEAPQSAPRPKPRRVPRPPKLRIPAKPKEAPPPVRPPEPKPVREQPVKEQAVKAEPVKEKPIVEKVETEKPAEIPAVNDAPVKPPEPALQPVVVAEVKPTRTAVIPSVTPTLPVPAADPTPPPVIRPPVTINAPAMKPRAAVVPTAAATQTVERPPAPEPRETPVAPPGQDVSPMSVPEPLPPSPPVVEIASPKDGARIDITDDAIIEVLGSVDDPSIDRAIITINGYPMEVSVRRGSFRAKVALSAGPNRFKVAMQNEKGLAGKSPEITVTGIIVPRYDIQVTTTSSRKCGSISASLQVGTHPLESDYSPYHPSVEVPAIHGQDISSSESIQGSLSLKSAGRGIYGVIVNRTGEQKSGSCWVRVKATLFGYFPGKKKERTFETRDLQEKRWVATKIMMPEGVFWDDNDYFTGEVEDGRMITKFRQPDGIVWMELKE